MVYHELTVYSEHRTFKRNEFSLRLFLPFATVTSTRPLPSPLPNSVVTTARNTRCKTRSFRIKLLHEAVLATKRQPLLSLQLVSERQLLIHRSPLYTKIRISLLLTPTIRLMRHGGRIISLRHSDRLRNRDSFEVRLTLYVQYEDLRPPHPPSHLRTTTTINARPLHSLLTTPRTI